MKFPNIRITPLVLFLITLFALFLSIVLGKYIMSFRKQNEGYINFNYNSDKNANPLAQFTIPKYSDARRVTNVFNNLYYDQNNGYVVDVKGTPVGSESQPTASGDTTGSTLSEFTVVKRDGSTKVYNTEDRTLTNAVAESKVETYAATSIPFIAKSTGDAGLPLEYAYIPWGDDTFLHVMNTTTNTKSHIGTYFMGGKGVGNNASKCMPASSSADAKLIAFLTTANESSDYVPTGNENKFNTSASLTNTIYNSDGSLFTVCKHVLYDNTNGNLVITDGSSSINKITIYKRSIFTGKEGTVFFDPSSSASISSPNKYTKDVTTITPNINNMSTMILYLTEHKYMVMYIAFGLKTIIVVYTYPKTGSIKIQNVARFDGQGTFVTGTENLKNNIITASGDTKKEEDKKELTEGDKMDDFLNRFFKYYYSVGSSSNDYLLKTQVVPPVCPTCPSCPSSGGVCNNCGGNGGSGTRSSDGKNIVEKAVSGTLDVAKTTVGGVSDVAKSTIGEAGSIIKSTVGEAGDLAKSAGSGATDLAKNAAAGAAGLALDTTGAAVGLARETAGGAIGLARETAGGAVGLVKDAAGGIAGLLPRFSSSPYIINGQMQGGQMGYGGQVVPTVYNTRGNDPYSMYGALQERSGGNYIPLTTDFSAFGR